MLTAMAIYMDLYKYIVTQENIQELCNNTDISVTVYTVAHCIVTHAT